MTAAFPLHRTSALDLFARPVDGEIVELSPPPLTWLGADGVDEYRVVVRRDCGKVVVDQTTRRNVLVLRSPLEPGMYEWDVHSPKGRRGLWSFTVSPTAIRRVVPTAEHILAAMPKSHPRHMYYPQDIACILAANEDKLGVLRRNIDLAIDQGYPPRPLFHRDDARVRGAPSAREAFGLHRDYVDRNLVACALGHLLLGDGRAADYAKACMMDICDWNPQGPCAVDGPWADEIGLSHARCLFAVYDWTYDLFDDKERTYIERTLATYARQVLRRLEELDFIRRPGSSHAGRIPAYLGEAAMVLHGHVDPAESAKWLDYAIEIFASVFPHFGGRDGGWAEGTFYGSSYTRWYLPFFLAVERHTGFSFLDHPFYRRVSQFFMHFAPPGWEVHPFCDGYWCLSDDDEWPGFFAQNPHGLYAERFGPALARRFSADLGQPEVFKLHLLDVFRLPVDGDESAAGPATDSRAFRDAGFVSIHSDISDPAADTALLARASKFGSASHQHADQGNFAVISRGRGLITPSGYFGTGYGTRHHVDWTQQSRAHNVVLIDGSGQPARSHEAVGTVEFLNDTGAWAIAALDISGAYPALTSFRRWVLMVRPELVVVYDCIVAPQPVRCDWLAHTLSEPSIASDGVRVVREPASMSIQLYTGQDTLEPSLTDRFATDVDNGVASARHAQKRCPTQYHLTWSAPKAIARRFAAVMAVNDARVSCNAGPDVLELTYGRMQLSICLQADRKASILVDDVELTTPPGL